MQNRASCIFSNNFRRNIPGSVILNKLDWMTVLNRRDYLLSVLIYKLLNNCDDINNCLNIDFHLASNTHNYATRYSKAKSLSVPFAKLDYYKRSLNVTGVKIVNLSSSQSNCNLLIILLFLCFNLHTFLFIHVFSYFIIILHLITIF